LLYFGELAGGLWATLVMQSALAVIAIGLTLRLLGIFSWPKFALTGAILGLFSSLPFFASFLLPDIFAGLAILGAANLLALGDRANKLERIFWISSLALAVIFHPTHLAIIMILLATGLIVRLLSKSVSRFGTVALLFAASIGFGSELGFAVLVERLAGAPVVRPPVLMARIIADGPGATYLREKCPRAGFAVCEFADRIPITNADTFLWDPSPATGVYTPASTETRRALSSEQYRFAAAVFADNPSGQLFAAMKNVLQQLTMIGLSDFRTASNEARARLPHAYSGIMSKSRIAAEAFPLGIYSTVTILVALFSVVLGGVFLLKYWTVIGIEQKMFSLVVISGELANAFVCGVLSGPHERYQARLSWLYPLLLLTLYFATRRSTRTRSYQAPLFPTEAVASNSG
jgi:hypothetical protein